MSQEGVVVKRYGFKNKFQKTVWGKLITKEFLNAKNQPMKHLDTVNKILQKYFTDSFIEKEVAKIKMEEQKDSNSQNSLSQSHKKNSSNN